MKKRLFFLLLFSLSVLGAFDVYSSSMHLAASQGSKVSDEGLNPAEHAFYQRLTSDKKRAFLAMSVSERQQALDLTVKVIPSTALAKAVAYDVKAMDAERQNLYSRLNEQERVVFFLLSDEGTNEAVVWAKKMTANQAVEQALQVDLDHFIPEQLAFYQNLTASNQLIYLALSTRTQENLVLNAEAVLDPNKAVQQAQMQDAARLYPEQFAYYQQLSDKDRVLFLSLTPRARGMAVALTKGIDAVDAVDYILALQQS